MQTLFGVVRLFPYWGLVVALTTLEIALFYRRRARPVRVAVCSFISVTFFVLIGVWFAKRGDLNSGAWVRAWLKL